MASWTARVEWTTPDDYDTDSLDLVHEHLAGHQAAVGREPGPEHTWSATVTLEANTLRQATATALELVEGATGERPNGVEVLPQETADLRAGFPSIPPLVGYAEIADMLGVSRQRAAQLAAEHDTFPQAVVTTAAGPLRVRSQVEAWGRNRNRKPGRPKLVTT